MCGLPGHGPGRPDRPVLRGRHGIGDLRRRHVPAAAADRRGGAGPGRRAAHPGRDAGHRRPRRRQRALAKVEAAAGGLSTRRTRSAVGRRPRDGCCPSLQQARRRAAGAAAALLHGHPRRDDRADVDPDAGVRPGRPVYLEAWCRRAEGMRVFRLDRIEDAQLLDEPARPPAEAHLRDLSEGVYPPAPEHLLVVLRVAPATAGWPTTTR